MSDLTFNTIGLLDKCISGNYDNFDLLLDPMYEQFIDFYRSLKEIDAETGMESSIDNILFKKEGKTALFIVEYANNTLATAAIGKLQNSKFVSVTNSKDKLSFIVKPHPSK